MALRRTLRLATLLLVTAALVLGVRAFLAAHPQHDPWAPLDLRAERGWATQVKLSRLDGDTERCHAVLSRSEVGFNALPAAGEGACLRDDRLTLDTMRFAPRFPEMSCQVAVCMVLWLGVAKNCCCGAISIASRMHSIRRCRQSPGQTT